MNNNYCVIMAGGIGSRFWPLSRFSTPKQFLDILGTGKTLLQQTFDRCKKISPIENILIVTNENYTKIVLEQLPDINPNQILSEPLKKNTAPCIAYAAYRIKSINPDATLVVAPSDHFIEKETEFIESIKQAIEFASKNDVLVTLGIKPNRPDSGYGYIQFNESEKNKFNANLKKVKSFTEKPDYEMAKFFVETGEFYWNSGIFIWSLKSILKAFDTYLPEINNLFKEETEKYNTPEEVEFINKIYYQCKNISIDYGIMEKADNVYVLLSDFGWSDIGTWGSLYEHSALDSNKNAIVGKNVMCYNTKNCIIKVPDTKLVVLQGLDDYIIVESNDCLLICPKQDEQLIRQFVQDIKLEKGEQYV